MRRPVVVDVELSSDVLCCGAEARRAAARAGLDHRSQQEMAIVAQELASNIIKFARRGVVQLMLLPEPPGGLEIIAEDRGPGIANIEAALQDGHTASKDRERLPARRRQQQRLSLGYGLGAVKRLADELNIANREGGGTVVRVRKHLPPPRVPWWAVLVKPV